MPAPQFPTYGRGDEPEEPDRREYYAQPAPYGPDGYGDPPQADAHPPGAQPGPPPPGTPYPDGPTQPPGASYPAAQPQGPVQPPAYRPGNPYGAPAYPQSHQLPGYGPAGEARRDPRAGSFLLLAALVAVVYGLLVLSVQRLALQDIAAAPRSSLNHPLRTDIIDALGQLLVLLTGIVALILWWRDLRARRRLHLKPGPVEVTGLVLVGVALVPLLVWLVMVGSTGLGAIDGNLDRLPTAYGWGGVGLLLLALGFALGWRALRTAPPTGAH